MKSNLLQHLEQTVQRVPEKIAFYDDHRALTWAALHDQARRIGSALAEKIPMRQPVALLLDSRSIENLPALLGALYAGCSYAPMDITMPPERLEQLLTLLSPGAILVDDKGAKALDGCNAPDVPVLRTTDAMMAPVQEEVLQQRRKEASVYDPVSILFTSGSTGIPKGSVQTHFSYLHWTEATIEVYGLTEETVFGNQSPFFYANSILDIFPPIALGASVYLLPSGVLTFPRRLIDCLNAHHVTEFCMTPSSFISVVQSGVLTPGCLPELKWGIMSGESMPWPPLTVWMEATPNADWWHFYGSTEMFSVAVGRVDKQHPPQGRLPVGKSFSLVHLLFVDEEGREVPPGESGEMLVSSPWVACGYHRDAPRTAQSWVDDPLERGWPERFYRAGDVGCLRPDGQLLVLGRRDAQIKHMGYRMELGEVEAALASVDGCAAGCVLHQAEQDALWCFYTGTVDEKTLRQRLKEKLARYMLPDRVVHLAEMPYTASMKLDRRALRQMMNEQAEE